MTRVERCEPAANGRSIRADARRGSRTDGRQPSKEVPV